MRDVVVVALFVLGFALLVTVHLTIVVGLARRTPRSRALIALFVPPLALYWAVSAKMRARPAIWVAGALAYGAGWALTAWGA